MIHLYTVSCSFQLFGLLSSVYIFSALSLYENLPTLELELLFLCPNNKQLLMKTKHF